MDRVVITKEMIEAATLALEGSGMLTRECERLAPVLARTVLVEALAASGLRRKTSPEMALADF